MRLRANREFTYMSRMLKVGDEFEATPVDARFLVGDASAEEADAAPKRRGRQPKAADPAPETTEESDPSALTVAELRQRVEDRGLELPDHYVKKDELLAMLDEDEEGDGA